MTSYIWYDWSTLSNTHESGVGVPNVFSYKFVCGNNFVKMSHRVISSTLVSFGSQYLTNKTIGVVNTTHLWVFSAWTRSSYLGNNGWLAEKWNNGVILGLLEWVKITLIFERVSIDNTSRNWMSLEIFPTLMNGLKFSLLSSFGE